jgi:hypothetical protein
MRAVSVLLPTIFKYHQHLRAAVEVRRVKSQARLYQAHDTVRSLRTNIWNSPIADLSIGSAGQHVNGRIGASLTRHD